jgi:hypothetical protein
LLCEANTLNRKYRIGEAERQLLIWANSAPPLKISSPPTVIDPILLGELLANTRKSCQNLIEKPLISEKSKIMLNGSVRLRRPVDHTLKIESDNDDMEVSESDSSC